MQAGLIGWTLNAVNQQLNGFTPPLDMRESVSSIKALPPLPGTAMRIVEMASDPHVDASELAKLIEQDPLLTAQIIRWASSSFYGYRGQLTTVHQAIVRVLGFNFVLDMALGLSMLSKLKCQKQGVVGTRSFWIHALASTRLMTKLFKMIPPDGVIDEQALFLVALLHNIGFPLFGHQFPGEFQHLNNLIDTNPSLAIFNLETFAFGVNHCQVGAWLMNAWLMPRLLTDIVYHHHNPCYRGEHFKLNLLTFLNDYLLGLIGIGDAMHQECPESVFELLGLERSQCQSLLETMQDEIDAIVAIAESLT